MKPHLPKQLFTALLTAITLAASPVATGAVNYNELGIVLEGNCYAHDYTFSFILNEDAFSEVEADTNGDSTIVLASYWGSDSANPDSNAIVLIRNSAGNITLKIGRGEVGSYTDLAADSTFAFHNENTSHITLDTNLEVGTVYTLHVTGGDQKMDPTLYSIAAGSTSTDVTSYKGNMNGNDDLDSVFNHEVATLVSKNVTNTSSGTATLEKTNTLVWAGKAAGNATPASWGIWNNISGTSKGATADASSDLIFDATNTVAKDVNITDSVTVGSISVYDNYTFSSAEESAAMLTVSNGLNLVADKTLILSNVNLTLGGHSTISGTITTGGTIALAEGSTLRLNKSLSNLTSTITGSGRLEIGYNAGLLGAFSNADFKASGTLAVVSGGVVSMTSGNLNTLTNAIEVDGGELTLTRQNGDIAKSITVTNGGKLVLANTDIMSESASNTISISDSELAVGNNRIASGSGTKYVFNNATVTGTGDAHGALDFSGNASITSSGTSSIEGALRIRGGKTLTINVVNALTVGTIVGVNDSSSLTKTGTGTLVITSMTSKQEAFIRGTTTISEGAVEYNLSTDGTYSGQVVGAGTLKKSGTGTLTLSGAIGSSAASLGSISVTGGELKLSSASPAYIGTVSVSDGSKLNFNDVNATISGAVTLGSNANLTVGSGSIKGALNFTSDGASLTQSGEGILNLTGGVTIAQNVGATLTGKLGLGSTITNNGTLTLSGSIELLGELASFEQKDPGNSTYSLGNENGFYNVSSAQYWLTSSGGTLKDTLAENISITRGEAEYETGIENDKVYFTTNGDIAGTVFFVTTNDSVTGVVSVDAEAAAKASGYTLRGGTMQLKSGATTKAGAVVTATSAGTINLAAGSTLNSFTKEGSGTITLTGSGTYDLGSNTSTNVSGLTAEAWTGTVRISSATTSAGVNLNSFGNSKSYLELSGVAKWLSERTTNVNLLLKEHETESYGFKMTGTDAGRTYAFNGSISGDGDLVIGNNNEYSGSRTFTFAGDLSKWEGRLVLGLSYGANKNNPTVNLTYAGSADAAPTFFSGDDSGIRVDENHAGTLTVNIGNATRTAVMNGSITNVNTNDNGEEVVQGSIDLNVVGDTNFNKDVVVTKMVVNAGKTATLTGNANSLKAGDATITSKAETDAALSNVTVQAGSISATSTATGAKGSISNADVRIAQLAQDATFTIEDMTLTNTTITAATVDTVDTKVNLSNVSASNLALAAGKFTMEATPAVGGGGTAVNFGTGVSSLAAGSATLTLNLDMMGAYESIGAANNVTLIITLGVSGAEFNDYTVEKWQALVGFDGWLGTMLENQNATYQVADGAAQVSEGASTPAVSYGYAAGEGGSVGTLTITITGLNVPEPTTSTLSLLALAGLCARRRRND